MGGNTLTKVIAYAKPAGTHAARWTIILIGIGLMLFEVDDLSDNKLFPFIGYVWSDVFGARPIIPWLVGIISYHVALRHRERRREEYEHPIRKAIRTAALTLDPKELSESALKMGIMLRFDENGMIVASDPIVQEEQPAQPANPPQPAKPAAPPAPPAPPAGGKPNG